MIKLNSLSEIDNSTKEGKILLAAISLIKKSNDHSDDFILNNLNEIVNDMFISPEQKLKKDIQNIIFDNVINKYYNQKTGKPVETYDEIPTIFHDAINKNLDDLILVLKSFGIFQQK